MASIPISLLAGLLGPKLIKTVMSETGNIHSLESTEHSAMQQAQMDNRTTINVAGVPKDMNNDGPSQAVNVDQFQAMNKANFADTMADAVVCSQFNVSTATTVNTVVYQTPIAPRDVVSTNTTRVSYLSRLYSYWRGSMIFTAIFTKSILVQTKLIMVFVPGASPSDAAPSASQATMYKHHIIMNPANEQNYSLEIPFISTSIFNTMQEFTGMMYIIVFEPLVVSFQATSGTTPILPVTLMFSAPGMDFREYDIVPSIDNTNVPYVPAEYAYAIIATSYAAITSMVYTPAINRSFITDSGNLTLLKGWNSSSSYTNARDVPLAGLDFIETVPGKRYSPSSCKTIFGSPLPGEISVLNRYVYLPDSPGDTVAHTGAYGFNVCTSAQDNIWVEDIPNTNTQNNTVNTFSQELIPVFQFPVIITTLLSAFEIAEFRSLSARLRAL